MIWLDLLKRLDNIRSSIRTHAEFQKNPRAIVPADFGSHFEELVAAVKDESGPKTVTLELDVDGKPIITNDLADLFATVPAAANPVLADRPSAGVIRRNPVLAGSTAPEQKKDAEPKAVMLPRTTPRIERPPDLQDATEDTVEK